MQYKESRAASEQSGTESAVQIETLKQENGELIARIEKLENENKYLRNLLEELKAQMNKIVVNENKEVTVNENRGVQETQPKLNQGALKQKETEKTVQKRSDNITRKDTPTGEKSKPQIQQTGEDRTQTPMNQLLQRNESKESQDQGDQFESLPGGDTTGRERAGSKASLDHFQSSQPEIEKALSGRGTRKTSLSSLREFVADNGSSSNTARADGSDRRGVNNKAIEKLKDPMTPSPLHLNKIGHATERASSRSSEKRIQNHVASGTPRRQLFEPIERVQAQIEDKRVRPVLVDKQVQTDLETGMDIPFQQFQQTTNGSLQGLKGRNKHPLSVSTTNMRMSPRLETLSPELKELDYRLQLASMLNTPEGSETYSAKFRALRNSERQQRVLSTEQPSPRNRASIEYPQFKTEEEYLLTQRANSNSGFSKLMISPRYSYQSPSHYPSYDRQAKDKLIISPEKPNSLHKRVLSESALKPHEELIDQRRGSNGQGSIFKLEDQPVSNDEAKKQAREQELMAMYSSMVEKIRVSPDTKKIFKHMARERASEADKALDEKNLEVDFELFKEYYTKLQNIHKKCGSDCPHLKRFYQKIGYHPQNHNRTYLHLNITDIDKLPRIIKKVYVKPDWKHQYPAIPDAGKF